MVNKARINYWVDVGLVITFIASMITGLIKWPGLFRLTGIRHRDLPMLEISLVHDWSGLLMVILVLVHLILHFNWMVTMTKCLFKKKKGVGKCEK
ncbi:DUF4405 domain-containing protein [Candidatus Woesearchaeota archaeon]|nr:DUF4405 domain-containing protein [Candidatus Woesearchaeota archaeon]